MFGKLFGKKKETKVKAPEAPILHWMEEEIQAPRRRSRLYSRLPAV